MTHDERMHELLYSNEGRVEQCERICKLEGLVFDTLAFTLACVCHLNEIAGLESMEPSSPVTTEFAKLLQCAEELGVPDV